MRNLSEEIINRYLTGQCSEEELIEVNAWISESDENARQLFRMEEIYHLGKFDHYADEQRMANAEKRLYKQLSQEKKKKSSPGAGNRNIPKKRFWNTRTGSVR